ncbi:MAG: hypothetical protein ACREHF_05175 [Rhizomicrobium sp.]
MRNEAERPTWVDRGGAGWRAVTLVVVLAFTLQSYITQTHLHAQSHAGAAQVTLDAPHHGKTPLDEGVGACPFCQATVHAGAFFVPSSPVLVLPASPIGFVSFAPTPAAPVPGVAHTWYSRAPPPSAM